jgi:heme exporter protein A
MSVSLPAEDSVPLAPPMIEIRNLTKAFGSKVALRALNLRIAEGESLVVFGPNGAGKTTLIRILASLSRPTGGSVHIAGLDLKTHAEAIRRHLGVVSHAPLLYDSLTAEENLRFFGRLYGMGNAEARITLMLERVGLAGRRRDLVRTFSRGMVQRLSIARALLHDPAVLLLDEPDTGLDPQAAEMLHSLLAELSGRSRQIPPSSSDLLPDTPGASQASTAGRRTIVTITHNLERGLAIADRIAILANGRLVHEATVQGLKTDALRPLYDQYVGGGR